MGVVYKRLWKLLIDKDMKKADVRKLSNISASTFAKMSRNEYVAMEVLIRICIALNCNFDDIVEIVRDET
jgi:DNA-binding Xre family transcriptional regulator